MWLVPPVVVTCVARVWVRWLGRTGRGEVDRDAAVRRLAEALQREEPRGPAVPYSARVPVRDRSTGIAVRPSRATRPSAPGDRRVS